jgi:hypothetical protein
MAVEPLYNADLETLLNRVRIETADDAQTLALIHQSVNEVRLGFYSKLGTARATTIAGYPLVDNPTSDNEILRAGGANTEANWLTWLLAQRLPWTSMDNSASTADSWNDEQLTRDAKGLKEFLDALKILIDEGLADLMEPPEENSGASKASSITNDDAPDLIYDRFLGLYPRGTNTSNIGVI